MQAQFSQQTNAQTPRVYYQYTCEGFRIAPYGNFLGSNCDEYGVVFDVWDVYTEQQGRSGRFARCIPVRFYPIPSMERPMPIFKAVSLAAQEPQHTPSAVHENPPCEDSDIERITDNDQVGYVKSDELSAPSTDLFKASPELLSLLIDKTAESAACALTSKLTQKSEPLDPEEASRYSLITLGSSAAAVSSSDQSTQEEPVNSTVEPASARPIKSAGWQPTLRERDSLMIGTCYSKGGHYFAGQEHVQKRLDFFFRICQFFEEKRSDIQGFRVINETWAERQYVPYVPRQSPLSRKKAVVFENAHISIFPKIILVKDKTKGKETKYQLRDHVIKYLGINGSEHTTTVNYLLNVCDSAPSFLNEIDSLMENSPQTIGMRSIAVDLFNRIIKGSLNAEGAAKKFAQQYHQKLDVLKADLKGEQNPYPKSSYNYKDFELLRARQEKSMDCLEGMLSAKKAWCQLRNFKN